MERYHDFPMSELQRGNRQNSETDTLDILTARSASALIILQSHGRHFAMDSGLLSCQLAPFI